MNLSLYRFCQQIGVPPVIWMIPNPMKIYEFLELTRLSNLGRNDEVVDLGCGKGHWTIALGRKCKHAVGVDTDPQKIKIANAFLRHSKMKHRVDFILNTLEDAGLPDNSVDHLFSFCVLEHIQNLHAVLLDAKRVLKSAGKIHVSVDSLATIKNQELLEKHKEDNSVVQYFTQETLDAQLRSAGFQMETIYPIIKGEFARREFERRIQQSYKYNIFKRIQIYRRFLEDDRKIKDGNGIMLIAHAVRKD